MNQTKHMPVSRAETAPTGIPPGAAWFKQAELWMGIQGDWLGSVETAMSEWMRRQHEAFQTSCRSLQRICDSRDIADLLQAQHEWFSDCLHWTASEIRAVGSDAATITRKTVKRAGDAAREQANELREQTKVFAKAEADQPLQRAAE